MPNITQAVPLWFTFSTIALLLALTGLGIWAVMIKKRKLNKESK